MSLFVRRKKPGPLKPTANPYPSRFQRWRHSLGITFILMLGIGGALRFYTPVYEIFEQELFEGTALLQGALIQPFRKTQGLLKDTYVFMHLEEDYARLKKENESLKWQLQALQPLQYENAALRQNLRLPALEKQRHLTARILSNPYDGLHHFFLIAAGQNQGLKKDQAVIAYEGVVGRLEKVGNSVSRVLLLNDASSRIPVRTEASEQKAILAGDGSFFPALVYVADVRKIQKGEKVMTSGLGGIFPANLPIGIVDEITNGKVKVRPYAPFHKLEWVHLLQIDSEEFHNELKSAMEGE